MVDLRTAIVMFLGGSIVRKPDYRDFQTHRDGNRSRILETTIRNATTTPRPYNTVFNKSTLSE